MPKLTLEQETQIRILRKQGRGYKAIAAELSLSRDTVRNFCRKHELAGESKDASVTVKGVQCQQCGKPLPLQTTGRKRLFCSNTCRYKWWHENGSVNPIPMGCREEKSCAYCGNPILDYKKRKRRYCSHECYIRDRFWRLEDGKEPYIPPRDR